MNILPINNCKPAKCPNKKVLYSVGNVVGQKAIKAIPFCKSSPPNETQTYGYKFEPGPVVSFEPITEIPFLSKGPMSNVSQSENGFIVPAGVYEIAVQLNAKYNSGLLEMAFAIAIKGIPLDTTKFVLSSGAPSAGTLTVQTLNSGDSISVVTFNPSSLSVFPINGSLIIKKIG